jgi:hypothetical protein
LNKQSPEYIRVREIIAKFLCTDVIAEFKWEWLGETDKERHRKQADFILSIKGIGIIADDQTIPKGLTARLNLPELDHYLYDETALSKSNFKKED